MKVDLSDICFPWLTIDKVEEVFSDTKYGYYSMVLEIIPVPGLKREIYGEEVFPL